MHANKLTSLIFFEPMIKLHRKTEHSYRKRTYFPIYIAVIAAVIIVFFHTVSMDLMQ